MWRPLKRVNDAAADYTENLPWGDLTDLKPPITKALCPTTESLTALIDDLDAMKLPRVPPHSLDMERGVKLLTFKQDGHEEDFARLQAAFWVRKIKLQIKPISASAA